MESPTVQIPYESLKAADELLKVPKEHIKRIMQGDDSDELSQSKRILNIRTVLLGRYQFQIDVNDPPPTIAY
jgi:hypothetical protein